MWAREPKGNHTAYENPCARYHSNVDSLSLHPLLGVLAPLFLVVRLMVRRMSSHNHHDGQGMTPLQRFLIFLCLPPSSLLSLHHGDLTHPISLFVERWQIKNASSLISLYFVHSHYNYPYHRHHHPHHARFPSIRSHCCTSSCPHHPCSAFSATQCEKGFV